MLSALLARKLNGDLKREPSAIEDLVTSTVLGVCSYLPANDALTPFLRLARDANGNDLGNCLVGVAKAELEFWPAWGPISSSEAGPGTPGGEPDVVVSLMYADGRKPVMLVIESKVLSGKSSMASNDPARIDDQLGKYWHLLQSHAGTTKNAVGVIYLTLATSLPVEEFEKTQNELSAKGAKNAKLYWLSWRSFVAAMDPERDKPNLHPMLADLIQVLRIWGMVDVSMKEWPEPVALGPRWQFLAESTSKPGVTG